MARVYVNVGCVLNTEGVWVPMRIDWADGRDFKIDKITEITEVQSMKPGGVSCKRFTCIIKGKPKFLYSEEGKWYVEAR